MHRLTRAALFAALSLAPLALGRSASAEPQDAMVGVDAGEDNFLYGSMLKPDGDQPAPFVLIVPASGTVDRNGNAVGDGPKSDTYELLAQALAAKGIGSLRTDRRGIAGSAQAVTDESKLTIDTYVEDTVAWAKFLALQPRVKCVLLFGHSEGALIAQLAAQKVKTCGVIEAAGAGRPAGDLLASQLKAAKDGGQLSDETYERAINILSELRAGRTVSDVPLSLASLFRPSLQPYLISWLAKDPVAAQQGLYPVLVMQGDKDGQVTSEDARLLANVSRAIRLVILPGADHALMVAPAGDVNVKVDSKDAATALTAKGSLSPQAVTAIADFIAKPPAQVQIRR